MLSSPFAMPTLSSRCLPSRRRLPRVGRRLPPHRPSPLTGEYHPLPPSPSLSLSSCSWNGGCSCYSWNGGERCSCCAARGGPGGGSHRGVLVVLGRRGRGVPVGRRPRARNGAGGRGGPRRVPTGLPRRRRRIGGGSTILVSHRLLLFSSPCPLRFADFVASCKPYPEVESICQVGGWICRCFGVSPRSFAHLLIYQVADVRLHCFSVLFLVYTHRLAP